MHGSWITSCSNMAESPEFGYPRPSSSWGPRTDFQLAKTLRQAKAGKKERARRLVNHQPPVAVVPSPSANPATLSAIPAQRALMEGVKRREEKERSFLFKVEN